MKIKYELTENDIKKILACYFETSVQDIDLRVIETTKGHGMQEYTAHEIVANYTSVAQLAEAFDLGSKG